MAVELSMYRVKWAEGPNHWKVVRELLKYSDGEPDDPALSTPAPTPQIVHQHDVVISRPDNSSAIIAPELK